MHVLCKEVSDIQFRTTKHMNILTHSYTHSYTHSHTRTHSHTLTHAHTRTNMHLPLYPSLDPDTLYAADDIRAPNKNCAHTPTITRAYIHIY